MKRAKKGQKIDFTNLASLDHQPFARLGKTWGIETKPRPDDDTPKPGSPQAEKPQLYIRKERRKGAKWVTVVYHLGAEGPVHLKALKKRFASGGGMDDGALILQGDHVEEVVGWFRDQGYQVRGS